MSDFINPHSYKLPEERLFAAIFEGDADRVREIIDEANISHPLFMGGKLLCTACKSPRSTVSVVRTLLEFGCTPNIAGPGLYADSPLHLAAEKGDVDMVSVLLDHQADIGATNRFGQTPLHIAARCGYKAVVDVLVQRGSKLDYKDCEECTPLFHAVYAANPKVAEILIEAGSNVDALNDELLTPLDQALTYHHPELVTLLLLAGCQVQKTQGCIYYSEHYCNSVFYALLQARDAKNLQLLLDCGHDPKLGAIPLRQMIGSDTDGLGNIEAIVHDILHVPRSLQKWCRIGVRRTLNERRKHLNVSLQTQVRQLTNLPQALRDYLLFKKEEVSMVS